MLLQLWGLLYSSYVRFWLKWVVRLLTGKCELQRVLHGQKEGARRTLGIGNDNAGGCGVARLGPRNPPNAAFLTQK